MLHDQIRCFSLLFIKLFIIHFFIKNHVHCGLPEVVKIGLFIFTNNLSKLILYFKGAIFEKGEEDLELAFRNAVDKVNDQKLLTKVKLLPYTERIKPNDSFHAAKISK